MIKLNTVELEMGEMRVKDENRVVLKMKKLYSQEPQRCFLLGNSAAEGGIWREKCLPIIDPFLSIQRAKEREKVYQERLLNLSDDAYQYYNRLLAADAMNPVAPLAGSNAKTAGSTSTSSPVKRDK
jgi:hypothetical protein